MMTITIEILATIIKLLPERFDTHAVEHAMIEHFPEAFANGLLSYKDAEYPLNVFSQQLALRVDREFSGELEKTTKIETFNLAGKLCDNQEWRKRQAS